MTLVAAGDIACDPDGVFPENECHHPETAALVSELAPNAVAMLGDGQYPGGQIDKYRRSYDPTWGAFKDITHPATGNHEYEGVPDRGSAPGHFAYFGDAAGDPDEGYYRWSLGPWTLFVLNSGALDYTRVGGGGAGLPDDCHPVSCAEDKPQEAWLRSELEQLPGDACVIAYWHHPRFSSGRNGLTRDHAETEPLFDALYDHGAELALTSHMHNYERFAPMSAAGTRDDDSGVEQFVVGTGGRSLFPGSAVRENSEYFDDSTYGVLELTLFPGRYEYRFVREDGTEQDLGSGTCHGRPGT